MLKTRPWVLVTALCSGVLACSSSQEQPIDAGGTGGASGTSATAQTGGTSGVSGTSAGSGGASGISGGNTSSATGCEEDGWTSVSIGWEQLRTPEHPGDGVALCIPEGWTFTPVNESRASSPMLTSAGALLTLRAYANTDHRSALQHITDALPAHCSSNAYEREVLVIDGWPAVLERYMEPAPICGACGDSQDATFAYATLLLAAGTDFFTFAAQGDAALADWYDDAIGILRSVSISNGETPTSTDAEVAELDAMTIAGCP